MKSSRLLACLLACLHDCDWQLVKVNDIFFSFFPFVLVVVFSFLCLPFTRVMRVWVEWEETKIDSSKKNSSGVHCTVYREKSSSSRKRVQWERERERERDEEAKRKKKKDGKKQKESEREWRRGDLLMFYSNSLACSPFEIKIQWRDANTLHWFFHSHSHTLYSFLHLLVTTASLPSGLDAAPLDKLSLIINSPLSLFLSTHFLHNCYCFFLFLLLFFLVLTNYREVTKRVESSRVE